jgi:hypothetical protein
VHLLLGLLYSNTKVAMSRPAEEAVSRAFLEKLLGNIEDETSRQEAEYMVEELFPVLIPGMEAISQCMYQGVLLTALMRAG